MQEARTQAQSIRIEHIGYSNAFKLGPSWVDAVDSTEPSAKERDEAVHRRHRARILRSKEAISHMKSVSGQVDVVKHGVAVSGRSLLLSAAHDKDQRTVLIEGYDPLSSEEYGVAMHDSILSVVQPYKKSTQSNDVIPKLETLLKQLVLYKENGSSPGDCEVEAEIAADASLRQVASATLEEKAQKAFQAIKNKNDSVSKQEFARALTSISIRLSDQDPSFLTSSTLPSVISCLENAVSEGLCWDDFREALFDIC